MQKSLVRKGFVLGIFSLLFCATVIQGTNLMTSTAISETFNSDNKNSEIWWNYNWSFCKTVIIDCTKVKDDLYDFPVLIHNISSDFIDHAQHNGNDFAFVD